MFMPLVPQESFENDKKNLNTHVLHYSSNQLVDIGQGDVVNAPLPKLSNNPIDTPPSTGTAITKNPLNLQDYLTLTVTSTNIKSATDVRDAIIGILASFFLYKNNNIPSPFHSIVDESNLNKLIFYDSERNNFLDLGSSNPAPPGENNICFYISIPSHIVKRDLLNESYVIRTTQYKYLDGSLQDRTISTDWKKTITTGSSKTTTWGLTATQGMELSWTEGGFPLPASAEQKITLSLEESYGQSNEYSTETSIEKNYHFDKPGSDYKYDQYRYAIYQLSTSYKLKDGCTLMNDLQNLNTVFGPGKFNANGKYFTLKFNISDVLVPENTIYATQTPDPTPSSLSLIQKMNI
uniref:Cry55Aa2-like protein n=2 Tax=Bacillus cereus group TaxID=86661 RepID=A0A6F7TL94_BACTU|nr:Cry55Aa2-like protein [Bacillus thuringiensis]